MPMKDIKFITSVGNLSQLPKDNKREVILCGRSNVGKSSFINRLFNRKSLAKTSSSPGKTRTLNYYDVESKFYLVDLPGFGYAKTSITEREAWQRLIEKYMDNRSQISLAFHLIDSRHDPTELDINLNSYLKELGIPYIVLLTKVDKLKQAELANTKKRILQFFPELNPGDNLLLFSAVSGVGKNDVARILNQLYIR